MSEEESTIAVPLASIVAFPQKYHYQYYTGNGIIGQYYIKYNKKLKEHIYIYVYIKLSDIN